MCTLSSQCKPDRAAVNYKLYLYTSPYYVVLDRRRLGSLSQPAELESIVSRRVAAEVIVSAQAALVA